MMTYSKTDLSDLFLPDPAAVPPINEQTVDAIPAIMTEAEIAAFLGIVTSQVRTKTRDGILVKDGRGRWNVRASLQGYLSQLRDGAVKGLDGKTIINAAPKYLVVSPDLETEAEKLLATIYAATTDDVQPIRLSLVVEPRLTGDAWYLLADPASVPSIQYAYMSAAQGVQIQRQENWDTLGLKYRAFLDFGCGWLDWRGAFRSEES
ncbi:hypothetical protein [Thioclava sp. GXIMD4215]|uniref:phage major capsid protein n=1 Tax=Thioclava sp. GXIMD4215 TaxID=3131928 RepID=UPI0032519AE0